MALAFFFCSQSEMTETPKSTTPDELASAVHGTDRARGERGRRWVASEYAPARFDERLDRLLAWAEASGPAGSVS